MNPLLFFYLAILAYGLATVGFLVHLVKPGAGAARFAFRATGGGFGLQTLAILGRLWERGSLPMGSFFDALLLLSWCILLVFLLLHVRYRLPVLGSFLVPLSLVLMISASHLSKETDALSASLQNTWVVVHTAFLFLGDAAFAVACVLSVLYLVQEHAIKTKRLGLLVRRLPALEVLDDMNAKVILMGFPLLTLGILTGVVLAKQLWGSVWSWDPKQVLSLATWLTYAVLLNGRLTLGWRGRRASVLAIVGFVLVTFTFLGVNLLMKGRHIFS